MPRQNFFSEINKNFLCILQKADVFMGYLSRNLYDKFITFKCKPADLTLWDSNSMLI